MSINFKEISKTFAGVLVLSLSALLLPSDSLAGAWTLKKDRNVWTTSLFLAPSYTNHFGSSGRDEYLQELQGEEVYLTIVDYKDDISDRISKFGICSELEHGYHRDTTLIAGIKLNHIHEKFGINLIQDTLPSNYYSITKNYYTLDTKFGARHSLYRDDHNAVSIQGLIYPGELYIKNNIDYVDKLFAGKVSLLFGSSFYTPLGIKNRPEYGSYIDMEIAYKLYPSGPHHEFETNILVGMRPLDEKTLFVAGLYNTFHGWNYRKTPFDANEINNYIYNNVYSTPNVNNILRSDVNNMLPPGSSSNRHFLNFQIGHDFTKASTLFLKTYHNVFKDKSFKQNSYYLGLELRF